MRVDSATGTKVKDIKNEELAAPRILDRTAFPSEIDALRVREKAHTRQADAVAAARRRLPMVEVNAAITLMGSQGPVTLPPPELGRILYCNAAGDEHTRRGRA